jgi:hypothetical protein
MHFTWRESISALQPSTPMPGVFNVLTFRSNLQCCTSSFAAPDVSSGPSFKPISCRLGGPATNPQPAFPKPRR